LNGDFFNSARLLPGLDLDMAKAPTKKPKKATAQSIESNAAMVGDLDPDAWPKFEKLIKSAAKMGPKPHAKK